MIGRRLVIAGVTVALGLGTLAFGASTALAAGNGVGPGAGTTGKARACEAHAANKGRSVAKGINCTPTPPPPPAATFTVAVTPGFTEAGVSYCTITFSGSGLAPGGDITYTVSSGSGVWDTVEADGTYSNSVYSANNGTAFTFTAPTAAGGTIVDNGTFTC